MAEISKKTAQQIVDSVKDVCGHDVNFIRPDGSILASTNPERVGTYHEIGHRAAQEGQSIEVMENDSFYGTQQGVSRSTMRETGTSRWRPTMWCGR